MQDFLGKVQRWFQTFMSGRYGGDQMGMALVVLSLALSIISRWAGAWLNVVSLLLVVLAFVRILSRDHAARQKENRAFLTALAKPGRWIRRQRTKWANRKTKAYVRCPNCHTEFALPKGRGHVRATCPHCGEKSEHTV